MRSEFLKLSPISKTSIYDMCLQRRIAGLCLEFGVWQGGSINYLADRLKKETIYGFDSFEGLPEDWHLSESDMRKKGHFATRLPQVRSNVQLIKGFFEDTVPMFLEVTSGTISVLHIDSDLYSSAKYVLTQLNDRIVPGTVIMFDELSDWSEDQRFYPKWPEGEWKALEEWLTENKRSVRPICRNFDMRGAVLVN
jgi:hypothetical protein